MSKRPTGLIAVFAALAMLGGAPALAQAPAPAPAPATGVLSAPCAALTPLPPEVTAHMATVAQARSAQAAEPAPSAQVVAAYTAWQDRRLAQDFAGHCRYDARNAALAPPTDHRVVFFGDSITELWATTDPAFFANDIVNRGIGGQTTAQMVGRFQEDVIALRPRVVHILAGTNDIAGNTGPTTLAWIEADIRTMVELAKAHHIRVVLASVLPAARYSWRPAIQPIPQIRALNAWLQDYARSEHLTFVDYRPPLEDGSARFKTDLSADGVHPNAAGYSLMRPIAERTVRDALRQPRP